MTRSDFQKKSSSEATPNLALNTPRKGLILGQEILTTWVPTHLLDEMRLQRDDSVLPSVLLELQAPFPVVSGGRL